MSVDSYLKQLRATAGEPVIPMIAAKKPPKAAPVEEPADDGSDDEGELSFEDYMNDAGENLDDPADDEGDVADDPADDLTMADDEEYAPPPPVKPKKAAPAKQAPAPATPAAPKPAPDMAANLPQPDQAVSDMDVALKAAQQERSAFEARQQAAQPSGPVTGSSVASMRGVCESLAQASFKFALVNLQRDLLATMEDNGLINEAKKIAGIDPEKLTNLTAQFIPAGRLIPALYQLGWKPVHKTGINENYPKNERYELTLTNGVMFITVRGTYDWSVMQTSTVIRYATDAELRRYGLLREAEGAMFEAEASGKPGRILHVPSRKWYGATASQYPALQEGVDVKLCYGSVFSPDTPHLRSGDDVALRQDDCLLPAKLHGVIQTSAMEAPVAWCLVADGYALVPLNQVMRGCV